MVNVCHVFFKMVPGRCNVLESAIRIFWYQLSCIGKCELLLNLYTGISDLILHTICMFKVFQVAMIFCTSGTHPVLVTGPLLSLSGISDSSECAIAT